MATVHLVAGATGGVGRRIVDKLLAHNEQVRVVVRDQARARAAWGDRVQIFVGDTRQPQTLLDPIEGTHIVFCATGSRSPFGANSPQHVDYEGVSNLVQAAQAAWVSHLVLVSSAAVTRANHPLNAFGRVLTWKFKGEEALRHSGLTYTIVRPGGLTNDQGGQVGLILDQGDHLNGRISRDDVAEICVQAARCRCAQNITFEVIAGVGAPLKDWMAIFSRLAPDSER